MKETFFAIGMSLALMLPANAVFGQTADTGRAHEGTQMRAAVERAHPAGFPTSGKRSDAGWTIRAISMEELERLNERDPELYPKAAMEILSRLNARARYHIAEDVKKGRPMKVPHNFNHYKDWSALPEYIGEISHIPKMVLLVKDVPFIAWYENGRRVGDSVVCIGRESSWTRAGTYRVLNKDKDHISRSYTNAYGEPAPMPWAMRIYDHVWIHAGDIEKGFCSHGCINLPWFPAIDLYKWADGNTTVMIVESLRDRWQSGENTRKGRHDGPPRESW